MLEWNLDTIERTRRLSQSRSRRPTRILHDDSSSSAESSPERDMDEDNDSFMDNDNESVSSVGLSSIHEDSAELAAREERYRDSPISRLPAELLIAVFAKLGSPAELRKCMLVSKTWAVNSVDLLWHRPQTNNWLSLHNVIQSVRKPHSYFVYHDLVRRLNLATLGDQISDGTLQPLSDCKRIERLTLTNCTRLTDQSLTPLIEGNRSLLALDTTGLDSITDKTMNAVARNCHRLQGLNVTKCTKITDESLALIGQNCRQLKRVKLNDCSQVTDKAVLSFANNCHQLLEIDLHECRNLTDISVTALISQGKHLRELRLAHCSQISDNAFLSIPREPNFESLRILDLTDCNELQDSGVQRIIEAAPRLRNLVLAKCRQVTDRGVAAITKLGKNLHYVHLGHCSRVTDAGVSQLVKLCNRIRYIDLACCHLLTDTSVVQLATLPKLRRIGLVKCSNITDRSILALAKPKQTTHGGPLAPSSLERVHLSYCTLLTLAGIHALLNNCPRLTHLSLTGVQAFLREDLVQFCREAPPEFNDHQRDVFCVFSGAGVTKLRSYLNSEHETLSSRERRHVVQIEDVDSDNYDADEVDQEYAANQPGPFDLDGHHAGPAHGPHYFHTGPALQAYQPWQHHHAMSGPSLHPLMRSGPVAHTHAFHHGFSQHAEQPLSLTQLDEEADFGDGEGSGID